MSKKFRILLLVSLFTIMGMLTVACSPAPTEESATEAPAEKEEPTEEEEPMAEVDPAACNIEGPAEATDVNVIGWSFEIMDFYAEEFEKCSEVENIEVNVQLQDFEATKDAFRLAMAGGGESPFDIMHMANTGINEFGNLGWLLPLNDLIDKYSDKYDLGDITGTGWDGATIDGVIYGIPATANTRHLAYRSDILEEYGVDVPTTYDEVIAACGTLADVPDIDLVFTQDFSAGWAWDIEFLAFFRAHGGGTYVNADSTPNFNSAEGVAAVTQMKAIVDACGGELFLAQNYEAAAVNLKTGAQLIQHLWASNTVSMVDPEQSDYADVIKFAPAPAAVAGGPLVSSAWHDFYTIPATTATDTDLIFRIIMSGLDHQSQIDAAAFGIVTRNAVVAQVEGLPNLAAAAETIDKGIGIYGSNPATALAQTALGNFLPLVGTGEMTPEEALAAAEAEYITEATAQGVARQQDSEI